MSSKRIPVSEAVWKELAELRAAGQTYDDLLQELIKERKRRRFEADVDDWLSRKPDEFVPLSEIID